MQSEQLPEKTARRHVRCPACGGEAEWNPKKQALVCGYCGTIVEDPGGAAPAVESGILERSLNETLAELERSERGWKAQRTTVVCQACRAISVFDPHRVSQACDFCGSTALVPNEENEDPIKPESLVPMKVGEAAIRESLRQWYRSRWFAPNLLGKNAMTDTVRGLYLPYWTFDAWARADWRADSGTYYYTEERHNGQTRQVRHVRWRPCGGQLEHFFDDTLVVASRGVHPALIEKLGPYDTKALVPYDPKFLSGWVVERYQIDLRSAATTAREEMYATLVALAARAVPGDTHRNLVVSPSYRDETFKHVLLPAWLLTYRYGSKTYQVVANGQTGKIVGERPISWVKVFFFALAVLAAALLLAALASRTG